MRFRVLGPVRAETSTGTPVVLPGRQVHTLLATLLVHRGRAVSVDQLVDDVWGDAHPADPQAALQVRVSQLRKALDDAEPGARELIESTPPGYLLHAAEVDADRFADLAESDDVELLTRALSLWHGEPYADVADATFARSAVAVLTEQRLVVQERLAAFRLARGDAGAVAAELAGLVAEHPFHEGLVALRVRALYACGRQGEALGVYDALRTRLADELGLDPSPELTGLHRRILTHDETLAPARPFLSRAELRPGWDDELVGRGADLRELRGLMRGSRLVTLVGTGGVGKTRLAAELVRDRDDAVWVELGSLPAGAPVPAVVEQVLGTLDVRESAGPGGLEAVVGHLRHRPTLLVLDNCEQVAAAAAELIGLLDERSPHVQLLTTSRAPLGVRYERVHPVGPLALTDDTGDLDAVRRSPAVRLFLTRVSAHDPAFRLDETTAPWVARVCRRLDGLPLALELAAPHVRTLGIAGLADRLGDRVDLTEVLDWSWQLLDPTDQDLLTRLSVFAGGCTLEAAEEVCDADAGGLARLVDWSLLVAEPTGDGTRRRYRMLETVASYAGRRLERPEALRPRHAAYFTRVAEQADPQLRGPAQQEWLAVLDAEIANLRTALGHDDGDRLARALTWYWFLRGRYGEACDALATTGSRGWRLGYDLLCGRPVDELEPELGQAHEQLTGRVAWFVAHALLTRHDLARATALLDVAADDADPWTLGAVSCSRALLAHAAGDLAGLEESGRRADALFARVGDGWGRLQAASILAALAEMGGDYAEAVRRHEDGVRRAEELGLWPEVAGELAGLAWARFQAGDHRVAVEVAERALRLGKQQDDASQQVLARLSRAFALRRLGELDAAAGQLEQLRLQAEAEDQPALYLAMVLIELGGVDEERGDPARAARSYREALEVGRAISAPRDELSALEALAGVEPDPQEAARCLGRAARLRAVTGLAASGEESAATERTSTRLTAALGEPAYSRCYDEGASTTQA